MEAERRERERERGGRWQRSIRISRSFRTRSEDEIAISFPKLLENTRHTRRGGRARIRKRGEGVETVHALRAIGALNARVRPRAEAANAKREREREDRRENIDRRPWKK